MSEFALILGLAIIGLVVVQLVLTIAGEVTSFKRERQVRQLSHQLWSERVDRARKWNSHGQTQLANAAWNGHRKFVVDRRVVEAEDVCSFYLVPHDGKELPQYAPGQFLTFRIDIPGHATPVRCYSLSDAPNGRSYRVTIKRVRAVDRDTPAGLVSNYFHDHINEGQILDVEAPSGRFVLDCAAKRPAVLIGGGVGITPLLSMFKTVAFSGSDREVWLFYALRNSRHHIMRDQLIELDRKHENLRVITVYSQPAKGDVRGRDYDESGHVDVELLSKYLRDAEQRPTNNYLFYVCGPPPMMEALLPQLKDWGVPKEHIHTEAFGPASVRARGKAEAVSQDQPSVSGKKLQVTFARSGRQVTWNEQFANLLELAARHGVQIASACCAGSCGTCQVAVKSGQVAYDVTPDREIEDGCCLTCVGRPQGDLILDA